MSKQLLDHLGMFALGKQQRRMRVAKGMEGDGGQSSSLEKRPVHIREKVSGSMGRPTVLGNTNPKSCHRSPTRTALLILAYLMAPKREVEAWG